MGKCLFNNYSDNVVGYCKFHKCGITVKQMKCKECLRKECWYLEKNEDHPYWRQREAMKNKRKLRKESNNKYMESVYGI